MGAQWAGVCKPAKEKAVLKARSQLWPRPEEAGGETPHPRGVARRRSRGEGPREVIATGVLMLSLRRKRVNCDFYGQNSD